MSLYKFRVVSNGSKYRIQVKRWWFPIWTFTYYYVGSGVDLPFEFETLEEAQERVARWSAKLRDPAWETVPD